MVGYNDKAKLFFVRLLLGMKTQEEARQLDEPIRRHPELRELPDETRIFSELRAQEMPALQVGRRAGTLRHHHTTAALFDMQKGYTYSPTVVISSIAAVWLLFFTQTDEKTPDAEPIVSATLCAAIQLSDDASHERSTPPSTQWRGSTAGSVSTIGYCTRRRQYWGRRYDVELRFANESLKPVAVTGKFQQSEPGTTPGMIGKIALVKSEVDGRVVTTRKP